MYAWTWWFLQHKITTFYFLTCPLFRVSQSLGAFLQLTRVRTTLGTAQYSPVLGMVLGDIFIRRYTQYQYMVILIAIVWVGYWCNIFVEKEYSASPCTGVGYWYRKNPIILGTGWLAWYRSNPTIDALPSPNWHHQHITNKIVKFPCSRLSTARGPCLCNISWIQANWFKQYHAHKKTHMTLNLILNRLLKVVKVHAHAKFHQAMCSGPWVIVLTERKKLSDEAENNTAIGSARSKNSRLNYAKHWLRSLELLQHCTEEQAYVMCTYVKHHAWLQPWSYRHFIPLQTVQ